MGVKGSFGRDGDASIHISKRVLLDAESGCDGLVVGGAEVPEVEGAGVAAQSEAVHPEVVGLDELAVYF